MRRQSPNLALLLIGVIVAGCVPKSYFVSDSIQPRTSEVRVLLMPPDMELYVLTAGGLLEPRADWTAAARLHVTDALTEELRTKNVQLVLYQPSTDMSSKDYGHHQLLKLHEAVGAAILKHKYIPRFMLPTKKDKFDWSLGRGVSVLCEDCDAQYGLFIHLRDSYSSGGRVAFIILATLVSFGHVVPGGGTQVGFASLVDLQSGDIVWFNRLIRGTGDLRTPEPAQNAVKELLTNLPL
ncbi:MAG: hypothetical protein ACE5HC_14095 [Candidatus Binatia bacterium]